MLPAIKAAYHQADDLMPSLLDITKAELLKLIKQPLTRIVLLALLLILGLGFNNKVTYAIENPQAEYDPFAPIPAERRQALVLPQVFDQVQINFHLPAFSLLLLTTATVSQDYGWGTLRTVLSKGPGRGRLLIARLTALATMAIVYLIIIWLSTIVLGLWSSQKLDGQIDLSFFNSSFVIQQVTKLIHVWLAILPVIAFGLFIAVWARNTPISIIIGGMTYCMMWMTLMVAFMLIAWGVVAPAMESGQDLSSIELGIWGQLPTLSPHYNMNAVVHWGDANMMASDPTMSIITVLNINLPHGPWRGLGILLGYAFLPIALAWAHFRRQDVPA